MRITSILYVTQYIHTLLIVLEDALIVLDCNSFATYFKGRLNLILDYLFDKYELVPLGSINQFQFI